MCDSWPAPVVDAALEALDDVLRAVKRRYRLPPLPPVPSLPSGPSPLSDPQLASEHSQAATMTAGNNHLATTLAVAIEHARRAVAEGRLPEPEWQTIFVNALEKMIREAMHPESGDPAIQAMVLRYHDPVIREYASLAAHAHADRRRVQRLVNAAAHPAKLKQHPAHRAAFLASLHTFAESENWAALADALGQPPDDASLPKRLTTLSDSPFLHRLQRLDALSEHNAVQRYKTVRAQIGPKARSEHAVADGSASHQRGAAVEAAAARVLDALARKLDEKANEPDAFRVVTSMRAPATLPADHHHAKTEWDVVLLRRTNCASRADRRFVNNSDSSQNAADKAQRAAWTVCLLVEAKASVDAAASDLPRLLRGLHLLAQADPAETYEFQTRQGAVPLSGAALRSLAGHTADLSRLVLYCTNGPDPAAPRLLSAASRMQLLSAPESLRYAASLQNAGAAIDQTDGEASSGAGDTAAGLELVWKALPAEPHWRGVLNQYPTMCQALSLMVHLEDLEAAVSGVPGGAGSGSL